MIVYFPGNWYSQFQRGDQFVKPISNCGDFFLYWIDTLIAKKKTIFDGSSCQIDAHLFLDMSANFTGEH